MQPVILMSNKKYLALLGNILTKILYVCPEGALSKYDDIRRHTYVAF